VVSRTSRSLPRGGGKFMKKKNKKERKHWHISDLSVSHLLLDRQGRMRGKRRGILKKKGGKGGRGGVFHPFFSGCGER